LLGLSLLGCLNGQEPRRFEAASFQLYYGGDPAVLKEMVARMSPGQIVVVESRALAKNDLEKLLRQAEKTGSKVVAYLSIGELQDRDEKRFRAFLENYLPQRPRESARLASLEALTLRRNDKFRSRQIDVLGEAWRAYVLAEADRLYALGVHGLFLDTVDTVDVYIRRKGWALARRADSVKAMKALIRSIKRRNRAAYVLQNRGLNLVGAKVFVGDATGLEVEGLALAAGHPDNPDGVLWENAFAGEDEWARRKEKELREIRRSGHATVFALGYQETLQAPADFFRKCTAEGFVAAWSTSSTTLHQERTLGPP
jgi:endo-alpha-1,4-polygalactosaminidase (GH114 family)